MIRAYVNKLQESVTSDGRDKVKAENKQYLKTVVAATDDLPF